MHTYEKELMILTTLAIQLEEPARKLLAECAARQRISLEAFVRNILLEHVALYNDETLEAMDDVIAGRNLSRPFHTIDELMEELNA